MVCVSALWCLWRHLPSYFGFPYFERGVSLHGCSGKVQPLLLTLDEGYLLTAASPDLERGVAPLGPPWPLSHFGPASPDLGRAVACLGSCPWPSTRGSSSLPPPWPLTWGSCSRPLLCRCNLALWFAAPDLGQGVAPLGRASARSVSVGAEKWIGDC